MEENKKENVLNKKWFVIVMCVFFPPVGIWLIWRNKRPENEKTRKILTAFLVIWALIIISSMASPKSTTTTASSATDSSTSAQEVTVAQPKVTSISATYSGATEAGTVLDTSNSGIEVKATYDDNSSKSVSGWTIDAAQTLAAEQTSTVTISFEGASTQLSVTCTTLTEDDYKAQCASMDYDGLARNPDKVKGSSVTITGKVIQVQESSDSTILLMNVTQDGYGIWSDPIMVGYVPAAGQDKILEDDIVTIWGVDMGTQTYTTALGASKTVPLVYAAYETVN